MSKSRRLTKGNSQTRTRIYRAYYSETKYDWVLATSLEEAKETCKEDFPDKKYLKIEFKS